MHGWDAIIGDYLATHALRPEDKLRIMYEREYIGLMREYPERISDEDRIRIYNLMQLVQFYSVLFRLPRWRMVDIFMTRGAIAWIQENQDAIITAIKREDVQHEALHKAHDIQVQLAEERDEVWRKAVAEKTEFYLTVGAE